MDYDAVIFDLDGTLLESTSSRLEWLYTAVEKALEETGNSSYVTELSKDEIITLSGIRSYKEFVDKCRELNIDSEELWFYVSHFRARGKTQLVEQDLLNLVDSTEKTLQTLERQNISSAIVSNAPNETVEEIVDYFELKPFLSLFKGIGDIEELEKRKPNSFHLETAIDSLDGENFIYVGDSKVDIMAANNSGIDSVIIGEHPEATFEIDKLSELEALFQS